MSSIGPSPPSTVGRVSIGGQAARDSRPTAAAAAYLRELLTGPIRAAQVVATRSAVSVLSVQVAGRDRVISIGSIHRADPRPVRTAATVLLSEHVLAARGSVAQLGEGQLTFGGRAHRVVRYWPSRIDRCTIDLAALERLVDQCDPPVGLPTDRVLSLVESLRLRCTDGVGRAARSLVGLGSGSTPAGDDVLAGVALALRMAEESDLLAAIDDAIRGDLGERTPALSAELLRAALGGHTATQVRDLVRALRPAGDPLRHRPAVDAVLALGHTSGADLLLGLVSTLRTLDPLAVKDNSPTSSGKVMAR